MYQQPQHKQSKDLVVIKNIANVSARLADVVTSAIIQAVASVAISGVQNIWLTIHEAYIEIEITISQRNIDRRIYKLEFIAEKYNDALERAIARNYPPNVSQPLLQSLENDLSQQMAKVLRGV